MFDAHAQKNILIVMLQIFDNLFHYKNIVTLQWIKRLKLCMVTMATLPPAKELKIQVVSWQNEKRTLDVLKSPTCGVNRCGQGGRSQISTHNLNIANDGIFLTLTLSPKVISAIRSLWRRLQTIS